MIEWSNKNIFANKWISDLGKISLPPFIRWVVNYCSLISSRFLLVLVWQVKHSAASLDESSSYCYTHTPGVGGLEDWWRWKVQLKKKISVWSFISSFFYLPEGEIFSPAINLSTFNRHLFSIYFCLLLSHSLLGFVLCDFSFFQAFFLFSAASLLPANTLPITPSVRQCFPLCSD